MKTGINQNKLASILGAQIVEPKDMTPRERALVAAGQQVFGKNVTRAVVAWNQERDRQGLYIDGCLVADEYVVYATTLANHCEGLAVAIEKLEIAFDGEFPQSLDELRALGGSCE